MTEKSDCNQNDGSILGRNQTTVHILYLDARELPHYILHIASKLSKELFFFFEGFPILHANVSTNACKSFIIERNTDVWWPCAADEALFSHCLSDRVAPSCNSFISIPEKNKQGTEIRVPVGDKNYLPSSFYIQEAFLTWRHLLHDAYVSIQLSWK